ncbi:MULTISPECIES: hypothetical protein [Gordonibacter]|nr:MULTISPECIES: hypothetical protein [Gordonibacter]MDN4469233.1 hypothetical protein [Gordonibacter sp. RACS_AR68]ROT92740.1 hypothetical protein DMP13_00225 [Gordonibacter urolithinfaciens]GKG89274.1 hypothetical protein CE91St32_03160 [Gordonibacter pamelaeae]
MTTTARQDRRPHPLARVSRGFALFMNWFDGICSVVCGGFMAVSGLVAMSVSWNDVMPIEFLGVLPLPEPLIATWLWPGVALALVNGAPNIVALALRFRGKRAASYRWGIAAGVLLIAWTAFELAFMPNGISAFYLALGVLQTAASWHALRTGEDIA